MFIGAVVFIFKCLWRKSGDRDEHKKCLMVKWWPRISDNWQVSCSESAPHTRFLLNPTLVFVVLFSVCCCTRLTSPVFSCCYTPVEQQVSWIHIEFYGLDRAVCFEMCYCSPITPIHTVHVSWPLRLDIRLDSPLFVDGICPTFNSQTFQILSSPVALWFVPVVVIDVIQEAICIFNGISEYQINFLLSLWWALTNCPSHLLGVLNNLNVLMTLMMVRRAFIRYLSVPWKHS